MKADPPFFFRAVKKNAGLRAETSRSGFRRLGLCARAGPRALLPDAAKTCVIRALLGRAAVLGMASVFLTLFFNGHSTAQTPEIRHMYRIGVLADRGDAACLRRWNATAVYLSSRIEGASFVIVPLGYLDFDRDLSKKDLDFVITHALGFVEQEILAGAQAIATLRDIQAQSAQFRYAGVIFTRADRTDIRDLKDLKGKRFMAVSRNSLVGWLAQLREFKKHGIWPERDFSKVEFTESHDAVVYAVRDRKADAGAIKTSILELLEGEGKIEMKDFHILNEQKGGQPPVRAGSPASLGDKGAADTRALMTVNHEDLSGLLADGLSWGAATKRSTEFYPDWAFAKFPRVDPDFAQKVALVLMSIQPDHMAAIAGNYSGWTLPASYLPIHGLLKELRFGPYKNYGKISLKGVIQTYWPWFAGVVFLLAALTAITIHVSALNQRLEVSRRNLEQDIARRTQAENALEESEQKLGSLVDNIRIGIAVISPEMKIMTMNKQMKEWNPHIDVGSQPVCYAAFNTPPRQEICSYCPTYKTLKDGQIHESVTETPAGGQIRNYRVIASPLRDKDGRVVAAIEMVEDITDSKKAQEQMEHLNRELIANEKALKNILYDLNHAHEKLKNTQGQLIQSEKLASIGQLAAGVAHEINNPLGFISSNLSTLNQYIEGITEFLRAVENLKSAIDRADWEKTVQIKNEMTELEEKLDIKFVTGDIDSLLRESRDGVERIKTIVLDLKTFSHKDEGERMMADLNEILEKVLHIVWNEIKYKAELKKEYGVIPLIQCNPQLLGQVFINLLINAVQAIEDKGTIMVKTFLQDKEVKVQISDSGRGIPPENLVKIFEPFFTTKDAKKGTGLGLSVVYELVRKHGGTVDAQSEVGKGATFTVSFPI